jgi:hypothetical protein
MLVVQHLSLKEKNHFIVHNKNVSDYRQLKNSLLKNSNEILCLEFDCRQNKALPLLPNCEVFYQRLLWFYIFNCEIFFFDFFP